MGRDRAPTEGAIRKLVRKVREKGMLVDDRSGPRARTVRTPENIEAVAQIVAYNFRLSLTNALRDGHAPTISERIANKGLSASAYADNYNLERHSSSESLRAFQSIARYTIILDCTSTLCLLGTHDWLVFESAWIYANQCASSVSDASLDYTDEIFVKCIGLLNTMAAKNQAHFLQPQLYYTSLVFFRRHKNVKHPATTCYAVVAVRSNDSVLFNSFTPSSRYVVRDLARLRLGRQVRFALANYASTAIQKSVTILGWQERECELPSHEEAMMVGASESNLKINATGNRMNARILGPFMLQSNVLGGLRAV
ncbi:hypothetical protein G5I_11765 [Acromyrmex echinatior]|uniref:DUF4817 domain-containing protein n=1 Tax=Acromyrmex echinatior TaxID=103372 RepID=F4X0I6_ACREC|nr:hypothetical protein G5I_11765 [Acromyrmex echinatior]